MPTARLIATLACAAAFVLAPPSTVRAADTPDATEPSPQRSPRPKVPWLGLAARALEPVESTQLDLPNGFGLVVEYIFPDSPAADAGVKIHDILRKFDDQLLVNPAQLKTLVCSKSKGDSVRLTILRGGEAIELETTLGEHQIPAVAFRMVTPPHGGEPFPVPADPSVPIPNASLDDLLAGRGIGIRGVHAKSLDFDNSAASLTDTTGTYTLTRVGKSTTLRASKAGASFFEGEVTTPGQRAALPAEIRLKLETLEAVIGQARAFTDDAPPRDPADR